MPLAGTICCQTGEPRTFGECEAECSGGRCLHPLPILVNMRKNNARREGIGISASTLSSCPRQVILQQRNDYYEDPHDYYARWHGTFGHHAVEMDGPYPGVVQEVRFYRTVKILGTEIEVSGQPDWINTQTGTIEDHKFTTYRPKEPKDNHVQQVNVYRWLVEGGFTKDTSDRRFTEEVPVKDIDSPIPEDFAVTSLKIHYYHGPTKDTKSRHTCHDVPVWSDADVETYIRSKLEPYAIYQRTGSLSGVGFQRRPDMGWMKDYCPFRHSCNTGQCCLRPMGIAEHMP